MLVDFEKCECILSESNAKLLNIFEKTLKDETHLSKDLLPLLLALNRQKYQQTFKRA